jgi:hypothetical protein
MDVSNKKNVIHDLEENKVDFGLVSVLPEHLDLNTLPLMKNKLSLGGTTDREKNGEGKKELSFSRTFVVQRTRFCH